MPELPKKVKKKTVGLIVPDVHEEIVKLKAILRHYDYVDWVVFLSDFMDAWAGLTWRRGLAGLEQRIRADQRPEPNRWTFVR